MMKALRMAYIASKGYFMRERNNMRTILKVIPILATITTGIILLEINDIKNYEAVLIATLFASAGIMADQLLND